MTQAAFEPPPDDSVFLDDDADQVAPGWTPQPQGVPLDEYITFPTTGRTEVNLYRVLNRIATALETLAQNPSRPPQTPPGAPGPPQAAPMPAGPVSMPKTEKTPQQKRGGLIYMTCKDNNFKDRCAEVALSAGVNVQVPTDPRQWDEPVQKQVLDAMKRWGWLK